jgi:hypothetical protein
MIMSKLQSFVFPAIAALALVAGSAAHAAGEGADFDFISSGQTGVLPTALQAAKPAQAVTQLPQVIVRGARLAAQVDTSSNDYNPLATAKSVRTRAEVRAEMLAAMKNAPFLPNVGGEPVGPFFYASLVETGAATPVMVAQRKDLSTQ